MAENNDNDITKTDIFKQQTQTIVTLQDVLQKQAKEEGPQQIIYAQQPELVQKPPNYLLYVALGVIALILFKKWG